MKKHLSKEDRKIIGRLLQTKKPHREIAEAIGVSRTTIYREVDRNWTCGRYSAEWAQSRSEARKNRQGQPKIKESLWARIFELYNEDHSPEQIAGALKRRGIKVSHETIYQRIYAEINAGRLDAKHLRRGRKKRHRKCRLRPPRDLTKTSIEQRPDEVASRTDFGHWEGDTVEIIRGKLYLITLVERVSRFVACAFVSNKRAEIVRTAITAELKRFPGACKSITFDNGTEPRTP